MHCVFFDLSERVVLLPRHKIDVKEDITLRSVLCLDNKPTHSKTSTKTKCIFC